MAITILGRQVAPTLSVLLILVFAVWSTGCSFFMTSVDRHRAVSRAPRCSESRAAPNVDAAVAIIPTTLLAIATATEDRSGSRGPGIGVGLGLYAPIAFVYGIAALVGYSRAQKCRRERHKWTQWRYLPLDERLADTREDKHQDLLANLRKELHLEIGPSPQEKETLLLTARSAAACVGMHWSPALLQHRSALVQQGFTQVDCRYHESIFWAGSISNLPQSAQETSCGPPLKEAIREVGQGRRKALVAAMPEACRYGAKAFKWVNQAIGAAITGDCQWVRVLGERIRLIDPDYYRAKLAERPEIQRCMAQEPVPQ